MALPEESYSKDYVDAVPYLIGGRTIGHEEAKLEKKMEEYSMNRNSITVNFKTVDGEEVIKNFDISLKRDGDIYDNLVSMTPNEIIALRDLLNEVSLKVLNP